MGIGTELSIIVLLVLLNGVLAMSEIAMVSARKTRLGERAAGGSRGATAALRLAEDPGRFLSTVQIGITLVGILAGVVGGATLAEELAVVLGRWEPLADHAEGVALGVVVLGITYLSLVLGELVPKQLALAAPERIAAAVAPLLTLLSRASKPLVLLLDGSSRVVLELLPVRRSVEAPITEEELRYLLTQGTRAGVFEPGEQPIVERVVRLGERRIAELATPRSEMVALDVDASPSVNWQTVAATPHVHYPVYQSTLDRLLGVVAVKDLWREVMAGREPDLRRLIQDPLYLPESISALRALERVRSTGRQVAVVLDEHGGIAGLVTLYDILQAIVGVLPGQEGAEPALFARPDGSWLVDGLLPVEQLARELAIVPRRHGEPDSYTVGGLVMELLSRVPQVGDEVRWRGLRFEVVDMDGRRVDKVLVTRAGTGPSGEADPLES